MNTEYVQKQIDNCKDESVKAQLQTLLSNFAKGRPKDYTLHFYFTSESLTNQIRDLWSPDTLPTFINLVSNLSGTDISKNYSKCSQFVNVAVGEQTVIGDGRKWVCETQDFVVVDNMLNDYAPDYTLEDMIKIVNKKYYRHRRFLMSYIEELPNYVVKDDEGNKVTFDIDDPKTFLNYLRKILRGMYQCLCGYTRFDLLILSVKKDEHLCKEDAEDFIFDMFEEVFKNYSKLRESLSFLFQVNFGDSFNDLLLTLPGEEVPERYLTWDQFRYRISSEEITDREKIYLPDRYPTNLDPDDKCPQGFLRPDGLFISVGHMQHSHEAHHIILAYEWESEYEEYQKLNNYGPDFFLKDEKGFIIFRQGGFISDAAMEFNDSMTLQQCKSISNWLIECGEESYNARWDESMRMQGEPLTILQMSKLITRNA